VSARDGTGSLTDRRASAEQDADASVRDMLRSQAPARTASQIVRHKKKKNEGPIPPKNKYDLLDPLG
jgi:hypothetical protein